MTTDIFVSMFTRKINVRATLEIGGTWKNRETLVITDGVKSFFENDVVNKYGSWKHGKQNPTGFFRVERDQSDCWCFVDPEGYPHINVSINSVSTKKSKVGALFSSKEEWASITTKLLREKSFNSLGCWTDSKTMGGVRDPLPRTFTVNFMGGYSKMSRKSFMGSGHRVYENGLIPTFDPNFRSYCNEEAKRLFPYRNDPWIIGIYSDNELPFPIDTLDRSLKLSESDNCRIAAENWLENRKIDPRNINEEASRSYLQFFIAHYFRICKEAISSALPSHLYLGCRFHGSTLRNEAAFRASSHFLDVMSINWYGTWTPDKKVMDMWMRWSGRPFIITEFYAKGVDSGLDNTSGAGWLVRSQEDRGHFYQNFCYALLNHPGNIGWHWFRYIDYDSADKKADASNRNSNKGIVNLNYEPYALLLNAMEILNARVYQIRSYILKREA